MTRKLRDYFVGDLRSILLTGVIVTLLVASGSFLKALYRSVEYYKVQFDNVDQLSERDKVMLKGLEVGQVEGFEIDKENNILVTISIRRDAKLTKGTIFTIHSDFIGTRHIEVTPGVKGKLLSPEEVQIGFVQPPDTTGFKQLTAEERDSLVKHDPIYRLADTVMMILRKSKDSTKVE